MEREFHSRVATKFIWVLDMDIAKARAGKHTIPNLSRARCFPALARHDIQLAMHSQFIQFQGRVNTRGILTVFPCP